MPEEAERGFAVGFGVNTKDYKDAVRAIEGYNAKIAESVRKLEQMLKGTDVGRHLTGMATDVDRVAASVQKLQGKGLGGAGSRTAKEITAVRRASRGASADLGKLEHGLTDSNRAMNKMLTSSRMTARATGLNAQAIDTLSRQIGRIATPIERHAKALRAQAGAQREVLSTEDRVIQKMRQAFGRLGVWTIATGVIYMFVRALQAVVRTLVEVEHGMAQLRKVMIQGADFKVMERGFFQIAKTMGLEIEKVVTAGKIFAQQGRSQAEVLALTEASLLGVTAASLEEQSAVEAVTAATKIYGIEAANTSTIIDKLARVQARHAVTAQDLADAIRYVGPVVRVLKGDINDVIGITAALVAITRRSGKEVANATKTIFARLARPSTRQKFLDIMGVDIKESKREFKDLTTILKLVHDEWGRLSGAERLAVAQAAGGIRRYQFFVTLMDNYAEVLTATRDSQESLGDAQRMSAIEAETLHRKFIRLRNTFLQFGSTILKGLFVPASLGLLTAGLSNIGDLLEKISDWSPPLGAGGSLLAFIGGIGLLEKGVRLLLHSMIPGVKTATLVGSVLSWLNKVTRTLIITLGGNILKWKASEAAVKSFGHAVRSFKWRQLFLNPWFLVPAAIAGAVAALWYYHRNLRRIRSGEVILDSLTTKWEAHAVGIGAAAKEIEGYARTVNELSGVGPQFVPTRVLFPSDEETRRAVERARKVFAGAKLELIPRGVVVDQMVRAARVASEGQLESLDDVMALFRNTRFEGMAKPSVLSAMEREVKVLGELRSNLRGAISDELELGAVSDDVFGAIVRKLEDPRMSFKAIADELEAAGVPGDQVRKLGEAFEVMGSAFDKPWYERLMNFVAEFHGVLGGVGQMFGRTLEEGRIGDFTKRMGTLIPVIERLMVLDGALGNMTGLRDFFKSGVEEAQELITTVLKVEDVYFNITDSLEGHLESLRKQAGVYRELGYGFNLYERQQALVKKATEELATAEVKLTTELRQTEHALELANLRAGGMADEEDQRRIKQMKEKVVRLREELELFQDKTRGGFLWLIQALQGQIDPARRLSEENYRTLRTRKELQGVTENVAREQLKLVQLERYGADTSKHVVARVRERLALEQVLHQQRVAALNQEKLLDSELGDTEYRRRLDILNIVHQGQDLEIRLNAALEARDAILSRQQRNTEVIRDTLRDTLADWEGLVSGRGVLGLVEKVAQHQRELLADAVVESLPKNLGNLFYDPAQKHLQEQLSSAQMVASTVQIGFVTGAQQAAALLGVAIPQAFAGGGGYPGPGAPGATPVIAPSATPGTFAGASASTAASTGTPWGAIAITFGSVLLGAFRGLTGGQQKAVEENTRALNDNTLATADLTQRVVSAPATFQMPALKGQIPSLAGGGDVRRSGVALVHKGETVYSGPRSVQINVTQRDGENAQELAERIWRISKGKYKNESERSGSRGRIPMGVA